MNTFGLDLKHIDISIYKICRFSRLYNRLFTDKPTEDDVFIDSHSVSHAKNGSNENYLQQTIKNFAFPIKNASSINFNFLFYKFYICGAYSLDGKKVAFL